MKHELKLDSYWICVYIKNVCKVRKNQNDKNVLSHSMTHVYHATSVVWSKPLRSYASSCGLLGWGHILIGWGKNSVVWTGPLLFVNYFLLDYSCFEVPWWLSSKESTCNAGDMGLLCGSGRSCRGGNGNPLQYSCLGNAMDTEKLGELQHPESQRVRCDSAQARDYYRQYRKAVKKKNKQI